MSLDWAQILGIFLVGIVGGMGFAGAFFRRHYIPGAPDLAAPEDMAHSVLENARAVLPGLLTHAWPQSELDERAVVKKAFELALLMSMQGADIRTQFLSQRVATLNSELAAARNKASKTTEPMAARVAEGDRPC